MNGAHFCNALKCSFHKNLFLVQLVTVAQKSKPCKCARLSAPEKGPTVSEFFFLTKHVCDAPTCSFHQNPFLVESVIVPKTFKPSKCARISTPEKEPTISFF